MQKQSLKDIFWEDLSKVEISGSNTDDNPNPAK